MDLKAHPRNIGTTKSFFSITKSESRRIAMGRGILLWLLGVPIPVIIILLLIFHH
jgi:hypothetical protein